METRGQDSFGSGAFGAPRGHKTHLGRDYIYESGQPVQAREEGQVIRIGRPYSNGAGSEYYKLVEIRSAARIWRYLYVHPILTSGEFVRLNQIIGFAQNIAERYSTEKKTMINHVHIDCSVDPDYLEAVYVATERGVDPPIMAEPT